MPLARGTRLGPYEISCLLGAGGMGEVYRANDTRLGRDVAVKVLPDELAAHQDRLKRFEQEARLAGSLNHPNVLALYDVGSHGGVPYLVTELLEGSSLRDLLRDGPLPVGKAVEVAQQIARGLNAAHAKGVAHRDLKPANVFVTKEGHVKILDFGLAKLTQAEPRDPERSDVSTATAEGQVVGTLGYMAPEQVRGLAVDVRADIFAFGTVLYEMLSGRRAFAGETAADTMTAILTKDPADLSGSGLSIPPGLERIVRRCLEKDPEERFQSARDVGFALDAGSGPGKPTVPAVVRRRWRRAGVVAVVALVVLPAAAIVSMRLDPASPRITAIRQVTHDATKKFGFPVTEGTRVYYTTPAGLMQAPVTGGDSVPLELSCRRPQILDILASRGELLVHADCPSGSAGSLWLAPTTGGSVRPLGDLEATGGYGATWSPDGQKVVYSNGNDLFVAPSDGSGARRLLTAPGQVRWGRLSPDGRRVRYVVTTSTDGIFSVWEATADGGNPHPLLPDWFVWDGIWTPDGRYYLFNAVRDDEAALWAWRERGRWPWSTRPFQPSKLTTGPMAYFHPTISPDGRTIFALGQPPGTGGELVRYDSTTASFVPFLGGHQAGDLEFSRDGRWIAYVRRRDVGYYGQGTLWRSHPDGTELRQLTFPPESAMMPRWSPDGRSIAYMSCPSTGLTASCESRIVAAEGGKSRPVRERAHDADPTWSPDGTKVVVGGVPAGDNSAEHPIVIQVVDVATGEASVVPGSEGLFSPRWSRDGRSIAALSADMTRLAIYEFATGRWRNLVSGTVGCPNWTHDSRHILVLNRGAIVRVRVADGHVDPVASGTPGPLWLGIAPDDSPLALRDLNAPPEVYALDVEWP